MIFIVRLSVTLSVWADLSFQERRCKIVAPITECLCHKWKEKVTANGAERNLHVLMVTLLRNALKDKDKWKLGREDLRVERIHQGADRKAAHHGNQWAVRDAGQGCHRVENKVMVLLLGHEHLTVKMGGP